MTYPIYSNNVWDYLQDMPYMPTRSDREYILQKEDERRLKIWEYFFRIRPEDVGRPQSNEIEKIEDELETSIRSFNKQVILDNTYLDSVRWKALVNIFLFSIGIVISVIIQRSFFHYIWPYLNINTNFRMSMICTSLFLFLDLVMLFSIVVVILREFLIKKGIFIDRSIIRLQLGRKIAGGRKRISNLQCEIDALRRHIPNPVSDSVIKQWLDEELLGLWQFSKEKTGLGTRLVSIGFYDASDISRSINNPLSIMGPGELQDPRNIHPLFKKELSADYNKHLTARRAYKIQGSEKKDVIYGVYFIEYIAIADDMLATYGFFYDFIARERYSEKVTEQYYKDVVSISMANEYREIPLSDSNENILIEDAPTLTLSLSSGEERKVTFVNDTYFWRIKEKLDMTDNEAKNMDLVQISSEMADNATKALRYHLRKHKGNQMEIEFLNQ